MIQDNIRRLPFTLRDEEAKVASSSHKVAQRVPVGAKFKRTHMDNITLVQMQLFVEPQLQSRAPSNDIVGGELQM